MTTSIFRLGAEVRIMNRNHSLYNQIGRYLGASEIPTLNKIHRICFDGKVTLINEEDFCAVSE